MNIAPYKHFTDGTTTYTGTLTDEQVEALADKTLQPVVPAFADSGDGTPEYPYTIYNTTGWGQFCDALQDESYNHFSGKTVKLTASIGTATESCHEGCYYTTALGTAQGEQVYSITKGDYVTTLEINGYTDPSYTVSGLSFYDQELKCGDVLYATESDGVSLILANNANPPLGYQYGYTVTPPPQLQATRLTVSPSLWALPTSS